MQEPKSLIARRGIVGLAIIIAVLVAPAYALLTTAPARPAVIAFMDLQDVFNKIDMRLEAEKELQEIAASLDAQLKAKTEEVEMLRDNANSYEQESVKYMDAMRASLEAASRMNAFSEFMGYKLDAMMADQRIQVYDKITLEATKFAEQHGIDFIITSDAAIALIAGTDMQIKQQMTTRRIIYANDTLDITQDLIKWINTR